MAGNWRVPERSPGATDAGAATPIGAEAFRLAFEAAPSGMLVVGPDGRILLVNAPLERQFGYARDELVGRGVELLIPQRYAGKHPRLREGYLGRPSTRAMGAGRDLFAVRRDGSEFPVEVGLNPIATPQGTLVVCAIVDITERKLLEGEREALHRQLVETSRRVGMADVATSVLHNVGNVLNSVNVSARRIAEANGATGADDLRRAIALLEAQGTALGPAFAPGAPGAGALRFLETLAGHLDARRATIRAELENLGQSLEHIKQVVTRQQAFARVAGVTEPVDLADVLEQALDVSGVALDWRGLEIVREYALRPRLALDRHQAMQILVNLIRNASQAMREPGVAAPRLTLRLLAAPDGAEAVHVEVADTGVGIAPEHLPRMFAMGFTTKAGGHGVGLHSSAIAARGLGGTLSVRSDGPGRGATFTLRLPLRAPGAAA